MNYCRFCKFCEKRIIRHEINSIIYYDDRYYCRFMPKKIEVKPNHYCGQYK